jgi:hypothetical protein
VADLHKNGFGGGYNAADCAWGTRKEPPEKKTMKTTLICRPKAGHRFDLIRGPKSSDWTKIRKTPKSSEFAGKNAICSERRASDEFEQNTRHFADNYRRPFLGCPNSLPQNNFRGRKYRDFSNAP